MEKLKLEIAEQICEKKNFISENTSIKNTEPEKKLQNWTNEVYFELFKIRRLLHKRLNI